MVFFEQNEYYHGDIQTSNFIYDANGKLYPIDYEEIRHEPIATIWPYNVNLLFLIFMNAVLDNRVEQPKAFREMHLLTTLKKHLSPTQYEQIAAIKTTEKFFSRLYEILFQPKTTNNSYTLKELEILSVENFLDGISYHLKANQNLVEQLNADITDLVNYVVNLGKVAETQQNRIDQLEEVYSKKFF